MSAEATFDPRLAGGPVDASNLPGRQTKARVASVVLLAATSVAIVVLGVLLATILIEGWSWVRPELITNNPSRRAERSGLQPAILGTLWVIGLTILFAIPIGVGAAIYLEEYAARNRWTGFLQTNISNLAGVPSIVYGLLGLGLFVDALQMGRTVIAGALTMALLILPVVIIASQEAIRAVPSSLREAAFGLGATKWQVARSHVLPAAFPGIMTGIILSVSRAIGETAPLLVVGASAYVTFNPSGLFSKYTVVPMQIYEWARRPQDAFEGLSAAAIIVLMAMLLVLNGVVIVLRQRATSKARW